MEALLGNERLKSGLAAAFASDRLSHCYLLAGPEGSGKHSLARILAAAMECTEGAKRPCGHCLQCRKVLDGVHPDVITVDDPAKKTVTVEQIRQARADVYVKPNEGRRKIYVIPRAMDMNPAAQNALLKVIEEPPDYGAFLLLTDAAERLLPTIRSRSVTLRLSPLTEAEGLKALAERCPGKDPDARAAAWARSEGWLGQALRLLEAGESLAPETQSFAERFARRDKLGLTELLAPLERQKREQLIPLFQQWIELLSQALAVRAGQPGRWEAAERVGRSRTSGEALKALRSLQRALALLQGNVSPGAVCGALQVWLDVQE
ncbi:MAG: DNA polymerase III subunit [Oscillospiraceae bacterium]|jgi:DNA polymerase-3 subunit delta'|nr:DNA polymerase III subunit [Oscillospiraceae bacterium]